MANTKPERDQIIEMQHALGVTADGVWGAASERAAQAAGWKTTGADEAYAYYTGKTDTSNAAPTQQYPEETNVEKRQPVTTAPSAGEGSGEGGGGGAAGAGGTNTQPSAERDVMASLGNYDPAAYESYMKALQALETARGQLPTYNDTYGDQMNALYAQITGREPFRYDLNSDPLYQQYRDMYMMQGQQAMMDTMGQAATLTGGYGSTYSQAVGQQQYNAYLQDLNAIVPDLNQNAYNRWADEGDRMLTQYSMLGDLRDTEYGRYRDQMNDYWQNVSYAQSEADAAYNRGLGEWEREYQLNEDKRAQQASDYERLMNLMAIGYTPSADEVRAAGMSEAELAAWQKYFAPPTYSDGGGDEVVTAPNELSPKAQEYYNIHIKNDSAYDPDAYGAGGENDPYVDAIQTTLGIWAGQYGFTDAEIEYLQQAAVAELDARQEEAKTRKKKD